MSNGTAGKRDSHPIRLAILMLVGAAMIGLVLPRATGNALDPWHSAQPCIDVIIGSLTGLAVELYLRFKDRISNEFLLAVVVCVVLAIAWATVH